VCVCVLIMWVGPSTAALCASLACMLRDAHPPLVWLPASLSLHSAGLYMRLPAHALALPLMPSSHPVPHHNRGDGAKVGDYACTAWPTKPTAPLFGVVQAYSSSCAANACIKTPNPPKVPGSCIPQSKVQQSVASEIMRLGRQHLPNIRTSSAAIATTYAAGGGLASASQTRWWMSP